MTVKRPLPREGSSFPVSNVKVSSLYGPKARLFATGYAFLLEDCYSVLMTNCYVWNTRCGLVDRAVKHLAQGPEDGIITNSYFVGCIQGIVIRHNTNHGRWEEPGFHFDNCHVNYRDRGIILEGVRQVNVSHCLFYCLDRSGTPFGKSTVRDFTPIDIDMVYASSVVIDGNIFTEPANPGRVAVRISADSGFAMIHNNQFNSSGSAVRNESRLPSYCANNVFGGRYRVFSKGLKRYDDRTGTLQCRDWR